MGRRDDRLEIGLREFRDHLDEWLERAKNGERFIIKDRGRPIAWLTGIEANPTIERLIEEGVITPAKRLRKAAKAYPKVKAKGSVSDLIPEQRR